MDPNERQRLYARAKQREAAGQRDEAVHTYSQVGAIDDAARVLIEDERYPDAARLLIKSLRLPKGNEFSASALQSLDPRGRRRALHAAICFAKSDQLGLAARMFVGLGEIDRAIAMYKQAGDDAAVAQLEQQQRAMIAPIVQNQLHPADATLEGARRLEAAGDLDLAIEAYTRTRHFVEAAQLSYRLGRIERAGALFRDGGRPYEAARCFAEAGDLGACLDSLTRVSRDDPRYPDAAIQAIAVAHRTNDLNFTLEHFLAAFLETTPRNERELDAHYKMAELYLRHDFTENARAALSRVVAAHPEYRDARARLAEVAKAERGSEQAYEKILEDELAFRGDGPAQPRARSSSALPELPELPDLPAAPSMAVKPRRRPMPPTETPSNTTDPPEGRLASRPLPTPRVAHEAAHEGTVLLSEDRVPRLSQLPEVPMPNQSSGIADYEVRAGQDSDFYPDAPAATRPPVESRRTALPADFRGFEEGMILADRYRLERKIGSGGMAVVFQSFDLELDERVAIKLFTREISDEKAITRFKQELSLSRRLSHPNIIRLYDIGSWSGFRFISMELLVGRDLNAFMGKPMDVATGVRWLIQAADGLQGAHNQGVIHRDIKPHNIFICDNGVVKVMDFGIAKRQSTPGVTVGNMIAGTPDYMSPEQIAGFSSVTHSTDVYALGVVAYQMFTGTLPFKHKELLPLLMMHINDPVPPPSERHPIPAELERIILRLLAKRPSDRFPTCGALADALRQLHSRLEAQ